MANIRNTDFSQFLCLKNGDISLGNKRNCLVSLWKISKNQFCYTLTIVVFSSLNFMISKIGKISHLKKSKFSPIVLVQKVTIFPKTKHILTALVELNVLLFGFFWRKSELTSGYFFYIPIYFQKTGARGSCDISKFSENKNQRLLFKNQITAQH